jgi:kynureninase
MRPDRSECQKLDAQDPLAECRDWFQLPANQIYLDGNSLGALPKMLREAVSDTIESEWGSDLIKSWNLHDWFRLPRTVGEKIAPLVGAAPGQLIAGDSTSINLFKLMSAALAAQNGRKIILSTEDNFPTDLYMAQGLSSLLGPQRCELKLVPVEEISESLNRDTALLLLTQVDFRNGRLLDMASLTRAAHEAGAMVLWDLAHSAGALPVALDDHLVDMAVGCGYKYLNGGPGAPAFLYVAHRHQAHLQQPLSGWMGHQAPFDFRVAYQPAKGMERFLCGTPPVLSMRALDAALSLWDGIDLQLVRQKSMALSELFIGLIESCGSLSEMKLASPRNANRRGSQVSYAHSEGYAIMQALIEAGVIGDFREPDLLRFGFTPLYTRYIDVWDAVSRLESIVRGKKYTAKKFQQRQTVT